MPVLVETEAACKMRFARGIMRIREGLEDDNAHLTHVTMRVCGARLPS